MSIMTEGRRTNTGRRTAIGLAGPLMFGLVACDFEVTNPGPVADEFLNDPGAHAAIIQGARFLVSQSLWQFSIVGAETVHEITRTGRNFAGPKTPARLGELTPSQLAADYWNRPQQARWVAEDATRRFEEVLGVEEAAAYRLNAEARLIAGMIQRILGENQCVAVIDGGGIEPNRVWWERAKVALEDAIAIGTRAGAPDIVMNAQATLAQVLAYGLGQWQEAAVIAAQIPENFTYQAEYDTGDDQQYNHVVYITNGDPWRDLTVYGSFAEDLYRNTGDPRVRWEDTGRTDTPDGLVLYRQRKWTDLADDVNLASGREMILIRAEALLRAGDWRGAVDLINHLRSTVISDLTGQPIPPVAASSEVEAWTLLKNERRIELWLEGRRMFDLRRWQEENIPGEQEDTSMRVRLCFPVPNSERDNNPNIPNDYVDPINPKYTGPPPLP